ncbi:MAG: hypothetical protein COT18_09510 [Elusimicrobia bacterium CG08_land_8_20_14_0_20_59_10]|nr:MAG: hypothetical protein COT18_09510 [Elusimicrobia bacterium CG08_land_8_20_14_0_20_59_10]
MQHLQYSEELTGLRGAIKDFILNGGTLPDKERSDKFNELCLKVFALQFDNIDSYHKFCLQKGTRPENTALFTGIPAVPVQAFKAGDIFIYPAAEARVTFKTSGTSGHKAGSAYFSETGAALASLAIVRNARNYLFPDGLDARFFLISPTPERAPHLTMAFGITEVMKNTGPHGGKHYIGPAGILWDELFTDLKKAAAENVPAAVIGPSFGVVFMLDRMAAGGMKLKLPPGSRLLDAGGFKGKSREISRTEMVEAAGEMLDIRPQYCVNTLGMSELGTQYYDNNLRNFILNREFPVYKENPHWAKTFVVDLRDFQVIPEGDESRTGALLHFDLTNIDRALAILTDDLGRYRGSGFEICGRIAADDIKGCSVTIEEMLTKK